MRRRFIADTFSGSRASVTGDQAAHLGRVLRAEPGQVYDVVANGFAHRAEIVSVTEDEVVFTLHEQLEAASTLPLNLLLAVFKFDHLEWAVEKATELGIARIQPVLARRTEKHLAQASGKRVERWRRIAFEAAKQSRRTDVPEVGDPLPLKLALEAESAGCRILLSEVEQSVSLPTPLMSAAKAQVALAVGPEGGWTAEEIAMFTSSSWQPVTLGPRILRAETAAIAAIAIASSYLG